MTMTTVRQSTREQVVRSTEKWAVRLGKKLKELRDEEGLTLHEAVDRMGDSMSHSALWSLENATYSGNIRLYINAFMSYGWELDLELKEIPRPQQLRRIRLAE